MNTDFLQEDYHLSQEEIDIVYPKFEEFWPTPQPQIQPEPQTQIKQQQQSQSKSINQQKLKDICEFSCQNSGLQSYFSKEEIENFKINFQNYCENQLHMTQQEISNQSHVILRQQQIANQIKQNTFNLNYCSQSNFHQYKQQQQQQQQNQQLYHSPKLISNQEELQSETFINFSQEIALEDQLSDTFEQHWQKKSLQNQTSTYITTNTINNNNQQQYHQQQEELNAQNLSQFDIKINEHNSGDDSQNNNIDPEDFHYFHMQDEEDIFSPQNELHIKKKNIQKKSNNNKRIIKIQLPIANSSKKIQKQEKNIIKNKDNFQTKNCVKGIQLKVIKFQKTLLKNNKKLNQNPQYLSYLKNYGKKCNNTFKLQALYRKYQSFTPKKLAEIQNSNKKQTNINEMSDLETQFIQAQNIIKSYQKNLNVDLQNLLKNEQNLEKFNQEIEKINQFNFWNRVILKIFLQYRFSNIVYQSKKILDKDSYNFYGLILQNNKLQDTDLLTTIKQ